MYEPRKWKIINVIAISIFHIITFYSIIMIPMQLTWKSIVWCILMTQLSGFGVTGGVHRLWTHRSYSAKPILRFILSICYSMAGQNTIYDWVRDHRVHHKYSDTDADPHNIKEGLFFSHVGWLMKTKHPEVIKKGKLIDMSDITNDPIVVWHTKHFTMLKIYFCFIIPTLIPMIFWKESFYLSLMSQVFIRYPVVLNATWSVNSFAHFWGTKPYNDKIFPSENKIVSFFAMGEGWHNYHHVFPNDYKTAELGDYSLNTTTMLLDFFKYCGWAYNMKEPSKNLIETIKTK